jgi:predicted nuclease of predicted toxin-antitoxin system
VAIRLLLDENLSERLLQPLAELFPGSDHVGNLTKTGTSDRQLWDLARTGGFILTTRDEDFVGMSVLREAPPKVLWLNVGKSRNAVIAALLQSHATDIERFAEHDEYTFLAIGFYTAATSR